MKLSIVVPVYYNEENLPDTIPRLLALRDKIPHEIELIFVDDGSKDRSLEILLKHQALFPKNILVIKLTRNFGEYSAVQAGLIKTTGDCVAVISADLQDPPELLVDMVRNWEKGIKAVFAVRRERDDPKLSRFFSDTFYVLFRRFAISGYPKGGFDFVLIDRQIVNDLNRIYEKNTNIMTLIYWLGHSYVCIPYNRTKRRKGTSKWTLSKRLKFAIDSFVGFSYFPIRVVSGLGLIFAFASFVYGSVVFYDWLNNAVSVPGWTTLMIVVTFTAGIQMIILGVLGEYLWRILDQSRRRPIYVIDTIYNSTMRETSSNNIASTENKLSPEDGKV
jgi:glycosyltransferase involved in cell wall biosynthesis